MSSVNFNHENNILTINVPVNLTRRSSRKIFVTPDGTYIPINNSDREIYDKKLVSSIAKGFKWQEQLDTGVYPNANELARVEKVEVSYVYRMLRLTLLAPDIIESIISGKQPAGLTLQKISRGFPISWHEQKKKLGFEKQ
ncbi:MAG: hypothetical protein ACOC3T_04260 [Bacteroidota bacterium]